MSASTSTRTGWAGWVGFASVVLLINGFFGVIQGLVAIVGPDTYYAALDGELFLFNAAGWGWWNLIIGVLQIATSIGLLSGATWARLSAVLLAIVSAVVALVLVPAQPWWSFFVIAIDIIVIYALIAHGDELRNGG
ncbi:hypothetical protein HD599_001202 [Conyzicola lurida]|uniref:DUF7144 domain-containing protein n=1 Tax=Conyzicola lurida TaxID=1172621 RepID=A0A841AN78_9MICO|nr:hypothetical protein [Conyzicola lurida]MBB5842879.1 hypothetical protein [Conyzicola lurida]